MNALPPIVFGRHNEANAPWPRNAASEINSKNDIVHITPADVLPPANLPPATAKSFDELEIPAPFRTAVEKALTANEKMLWIGRPSRNRQVHPLGPIPASIGIGILVLAGVIVLAVLGPAAIAMKVTFTHVFGCVFPGFLGLIGAAIAFLPKLNKPEQWCRYCYVVTNRRALLVEQTVTGANVQSYLPQQLVGLERRDHAEVAGAGDLIFEYITTMGNNSFNLKTGGLLQQGATGPSMQPRRVPRGFVCLDQVREVEDLIRTTLLLQLEQALDNGAVCEATCACGVTIDAPAAVAGKSVKCPRCAAVVAMPADRTDNGPAIHCREDGVVPSDLKAKVSAGLDSKEKLVWLSQPVPKLVLLRSGGYLAASAIGMLIGIMWLLAALAPASAAPRPQPGQKAAAAKSGFPVAPVVVFLVSVGIAGVPVVRWWSATRTCYAVTNRRALVYTESPFGVTRDSYTPLEVSAMRRSNSWLASGSGDLIFRTVHVISRVSKPGIWNNNIRTVHYGLLAIAGLDEVEKLVRETLVDSFVDKLNQASAPA